MLLNEGFRSRDVCSFALEIVASREVVLVVR